MSGDPTIKADLSLVIITHNEERHIARTIGSTPDVVAKVFVVDSFSVDRTVEIALASGAEVTQHEFINQARQFEWALDNLAVDSEWIIRLDADEVPTPELVEEIRRRLPLLPADVTGVNLKRRHIFLNRWIKHGGRYPLTLLRIWRRAQLRSSSAGWTSTWCCCTVAP